MAGAISGKLMAFTVNGTKVRCQTSGTLTITKDISTDDPCKDDDFWTTGTVTSKGWSASLDAKQFLDDIQLNQMDIVDLMLSSDDPVELEFLTTPGDHNYPVDVVLSGEAFMNNVNLDTPANATATYTVDFTGNGPLTQARIPVTT